MFTYTLYTGLNIMIKKKMGNVKLIVFLVPRHQGINFH